MFPKALLPQRPASFDVLCAGEPVWRSSTVHGGRAPLAAKAGIFEIATRLARNELRVGVVTVLEDDRRSRALCAQMAAANVDVSAVTLAPPARGLVVVDAVGEAPDAATDGGATRELEIPPEWSSRVLLLCGVSPVTAKAAALCRAARRARRDGTSVVLDAAGSLRQWAGRDPRTLSMVIREADVVRCSFMDLAILGTDSAGVRRAMRDDATLLVSDEEGTTATGPFGVVRAAHARRLPPGDDDARDECTAAVCHDLARRHRTTESAAARWDRVLRPLSTILALTLLFACDRKTTPAGAPSVAPPPPPASAPAQPSASSSASAATAAPSASAPAAPLGPPGATIALIPPDDGSQYTLIVTEAGKATTYQFDTFREGVTPEVRLVDVSGDGRADTVFFFPGSTDHPLTAGTAFLTPPPAASADAGDNYVRRDFAVTLLAVGASSLDDVVARAQAIPARGVTAAQACALLRRAATVAGFRAVATPDARVILSGEPGDPSQGSIATLADIGKPDASLGMHSGGMWPLADHAREWCKTLDPSAHDGSPECDKSRPACEYGQAQGAVFAWTPDGQLRIHAVLSFDM